MAFVEERGDLASVKAEAAQIFGCSKQSIQNILNTYRKEDRLAPVFSGGRPPIFNKSKRMIILDIAKANPFYSNKLIADRYSELGNG